MSDNKQDLIDFEKKLETVQAPKNKNMGEIEKAAHAPLDDANVDRVCDLLETIAERDVSQLISVDLQQSLDFIEAA